MSDKHVNMQNAIQQIGLLGTLSLGWFLILMKKHGKKNEDQQ